MHKVFQIGLEIWFSLELPLHLPPALVGPGGAGVSLVGMIHTSALSAEAPACRRDDTGTNIT